MQLEQTVDNVKHFHHRELGNEIYKASWISHHKRYFTKQNPCRAFCCCRISQPFFLSYPTLKRAVKDGDMFTDAKTSKHTQKCIMLCLFLV